MFEALSQEYGGAKREDFMKTICVIPARMASSRFPGKPLKDIVGLPMIVHILKRCQMAKRVDYVVVATCDQEILKCVVGHGGEAVMTKDTHERCTDRVCEAIDKIDMNIEEDDFILMVQGDEVFVEPGMLDEMVEKYLEERPEAVNLMSRIKKQEDIQSVHTVKVVTDISKNVLYMSRSPIPSEARSESARHYQQMGVIGFKKVFLEHYGSMAQTPLEIAESVDMLRIIENGLTLKAIHIEAETMGIDTPEELSRAEKIMEQDKYCVEYLQST